MVHNTKYYRIFMAVLKCQIDPYENRACALHRRIASMWRYSLLPDTDALQTPNKQTNKQLCPSGPALSNRTAQAPVQHVN